MTFDVDLDELLEKVAADARPTAAKGNVADYLPSIAQLEEDRFGLALVEMDGTEHATGDADVPFPIQSISKVFSLVLAMELSESAQRIGSIPWDRVGVEPSGDPFNSLVQLEHEQGVPRNPMINAGALVVDDMLLDRCEDVPRSMIDLLSELAGSRVGVDEAVWHEEGSSSDRNRAMANLIASFGNLRNPVEEVLDSYSHQCAITMTARQLARAIRFLGNSGVDPATGREVLSPPLARRVAAIMLTCGTYDSAGQFAFDVGIPCKSGVAGAIVGVVTDKLGVCVWSPPLDPSGNSRAGRIALRDLSEQLGLSLF
jgi:glutaminase